MRRGIVSPNVSQNYIQYFFHTLPESLGQALPYDVGPLLERNGSR